MAAPSSRPAVRLTHPEKQLFESGFTKRDLVDYYRAVADVIVRRLEHDGDLMARRGFSVPSSAARR